MDSMSMLKSILLEDFTIKNLYKVATKKMIKKSRLIQRLREFKLIVNFEKLSMHDSLDLKYIKGLIESMHGLYSFIYNEVVQNACMCVMIEKRIFLLKHLYKICGFEGKEYVKESYRNTKEKLITLLANAMNDCKIAKDKFENVYNARIEHVYSSVESAFLYNDYYYITPCILQSVINSVWNDCTKENQKEFLNKFYNGNKADIKTIANDCLFDMFNNNNIERLTMLDEFRGIKSVGV
jgi:hypothetical protein